MFEQFTTMAIIQTVLPVILMIIPIIIVSKVIGFFINYHDYQSTQYQTTNSDEEEETPTEPTQTNEWECIYCQALNPEYKYLCYNCGAPKKAGFGGDKKEIHYLV